MSDLYSKLETKNTSFKPSITSRLPLPSRPIPPHSVPSYPPIPSLPTPPSFPSYHPPSLPMRPLPLFFQYGPTVIDEPIILTYTDGP